MNSAVNPNHESSSATPDPVELSPLTLPIEAGAVIRKLRLSMGLTQEEFAHLYNAKQSVIAKMEARKDIRLSTLRKVATTLNLTATLHFSARENDEEASVILEIPLNPPLRSDNNS